MATNRIYWSFFLGYGIKHVSGSDVWSIYDVSNFKFVCYASSLEKARKKIWREFTMQPKYIH